MGEGKPALNVSELFGQWRADNNIVAETRGGSRADTSIPGRIAECERDIGPTPVKTLGEIIPKVRVLQSFGELRPENEETILTGLLAGLDNPYRFGDDIELPEPGKGG